MVAVNVRNIPEEQPDFNADNPPAADKIASIAARTERPRITPSDRLGLTLCLAIVMHAIVILGVGFTPFAATNPRFKTLDIILVQSRSEEAPETADYLAQANLEGGGEETKKLSPSTPLSSPWPEQESNLATPAASPAQAPPLEQVVDHEVTLRQTSAKDEPREHDAEATRIAQPDNLAVHKPLGTHTAPQKDSQAAAETEQSKDMTTEIAQAPLTPTAATLISDALAMASLNAEIEQKLEARAKRPRRKFISASTREYVYASYMEAWRVKVERIGNLNYPEEARRRKLSGSLVLDVALKADGSVVEYAIRTPSGSELLDEAAIRIVKLASPFSPFPQRIKDEADILHITRTWQFLHNNRFASGNQ